MRKHLNDARYVVAAVICGTVALAVVMEMIDRHQISDHKWMEFIGAHEELHP